MNAAPPASRIAPATNPINTRASGPIQPRLKARLRKKMAASTIARPPTQARVRPVRRVSMSASEGRRGRLTENGERRLMPGSGGRQPKAVGGGSAVGGFALGPGSTAPRELYGGAGIPAIPFGVAVEAVSRAERSDDAASSPSTGGPTWRSRRYSRASRRAIRRSSARSRSDPSASIAVAPAPSIPARSRRWPRPCSAHDGHRTVPTLSVTSSNAPVGAVLRSAG